MKEISYFIKPNHCCLLYNIFHAEHQESSGSEDEDGNENQNESLLDETDDKDEDILDDLLASKGRISLVFQRWEDIQFDF